MIGFSKYGKYGLVDKLKTSEVLKIKLVNPGRLAFYHFNLEDKTA